MKILVTGWNGMSKSFIPQAVHMHLRSAGHEVDGWSYDEEWNREWQTIYGWKWNAGMERYTNSLYDKDDQRPLHSYDLVIHLGAETSKTSTNVDSIMKKNFDFSLWLLNKCQRYGVPLHYASSASVYGQKTHFVEDGPLQPQSPYAYSKYMFDRIVTENIDTFATPVIGFRYFNVYGSSEQYKNENASIFYKWDIAISQNLGIDLFEGSKNIKKDFVHIRDVCEIHEKMLDSDFKGIVNVGTGQATSIGDIAERYSDFTGCPINFVEMPKELNCFYQRYTCANRNLFDSIIDHKFITVEQFLDDYFGKV